LCGFSDQEYVQNALRQNVSGYLLKGMELAGLIGSIRAALARGRPFDPFITAKVLKKVPISETPPSGDALTDQEKKIIRLLMAGQTVKGIAVLFCRSSHTIKNEVKTIYAKIGVHSRAELVSRAIIERLA